MALTERQSPSPSADALDQALRDPEVRSALAVIAANAPEMAFLMEASTALLARSREIIDNVNASVLKVRIGATGETDQLQKYSDMLRVFTEAAPAVEQILSSPVLNPEVVEVIGRLGQAASEADRVTKGKKVGVGGIFKLLRELKDPQMQETLAFVVEFAKSFGKTQSMERPSR